MASSSISVVANALFLKRFEPKTEQQLEEEKLLREEKVIDPICGMEIIPSNSIEHKYKGEKYYFCNPSCEAEFKRDPEKYKSFDNIDPKLMHKPIKSEVKKEMGKLKCNECGAEQDIPMHCGQPMHKEGNELVCWMGASCGAQPIPKHHDKRMEITE